MSKFGWVVHKVIEQSDIVLEILDARFIEETRNKNIEEKVRLKNKILIHVINKCDYVDKKVLDEVKKLSVEGGRDQNKPKVFQIGLTNCVFISAKKHLGTTLLKQKIKILAKKHKIKNPTVGVIGYPNVGKSSVINALKGRYSAKTSSEAGYTKGQQNLKISENLFMIDTPGVISREKIKEQELVLVGAKNPYTIKDPDLAVIKLIRTHPGLIEKTYNVKIKLDKEETIEDIALKLNLKKKGNLPDIDRTSRKILHDWANGKIIP
jgi:ribosome biogenesis GTPase A